MPRWRALVTTELKSASSKCSWSWSLLLQQLLKYFLSFCWGSFAGYRNGLFFHISLMFWERVTFQMQCFLISHHKGCVLINHGSEFQARNCIKWNLYSGGFVTVMVTGEQLVKFSELSPQETKLWGASKSHGFRRLASFFDFCTDVIFWFMETDFALKILIFINKYWGRRCLSLTASRRYMVWSVLFYIPSCLWSAHLTVNTHVLTGFPFFCKAERRGKKSDARMKVI